MQFLISSWTAMKWLYLYDKADPLGAHESVWGFRHDPDLIWECALSCQDYIIS